jgi:RimJ/RimL family protein N-acetyltransferase
MKKSFRIEPILFFIDAIAFRFNKQLGISMIKQALSWAAKAQNIRRINLTVVTEQEAAIRLYQSFGFRIYGTEQETFSRGGRFYDEYLMTLKLVLDDAHNVY